MYTVVVKDLQARMHQISEQCRVTNNVRMFHDHHTGGDELKVIDIDISTPVYRMENYRTQTRQQAHIKQNDLESDFFEAGQENQSAQRAQHVILIEFAKRGSGETIKAIYDTLEEDPRQTEPLLITDHGVVVNGNRRLAAMRELFHEDASRYSDFQIIQAMVLPSGITSDDVRRIEVRLQMRPETRLPYDWTDQALAIRDLGKRNISHGEIKALMCLERESDVGVFLGRLAEAEIYLEDFLGESTAYDSVKEQEQQFIELEKAIKRKGDEKEKDIARRMCHVITKHSRALGTRAYEFKDAYGAKTKEVATRVAQKLGVSLMSDGMGPEDADDLFAADDTDEDQVDYSLLAQLLSDPDKSEQNAEVIRDACDEIKEETKEQNIGRKALKNVEKACRLLSDIRLDQADPDTLGTILANLELISERANELISEVGQME